MMALGKATIYKLDHLGCVVTAYEGELLTVGPGLILARCPWASAETADVGMFVIEPGDVFYEYYYPDRWFNIFEIHTSGGNLKGWYCNVCLPPEVAEDKREIRWRDLALDLVVLPDGTYQLADEDEFEALSPSPEFRLRASEALNTILRWLAEGHRPFDQAKCP